MSADQNTTRCTCTPSRGLACQRCYAPHYVADLHRAGLTPTGRPRNESPAVSPQLDSLMAQFKDL